MRLGPRLILTRRSRRSLVYGALLPICGWRNPRLRELYTSSRSVQVRQFLRCFSRSCALYRTTLL